MKARTVSINTNIEHIVLDEQEGIMSAAELPVENLEIRVIKNSKFGPFSGP